MADRELISHLSQHPAWAELRLVAAQKKQETFDKIAKDLIAGREFSDLDVAYTRGFFRGMKFLLDTPALEEVKLERALKREEVKSVA